MNIKHLLVGSALIVASSMSFAAVAPQALVINNTNHNIDITTLNSCTNASGCNPNVIHIDAKQNAKNVTLPTTATQADTVYTQATSVSVDGVGSFGFQKSNCQAETNAGDTSGYAGKINFFFNPANAKQLCCETNTSMYCSDNANP